MKLVICILASVILIGSVVTAVAEHLQAQGLPYAAALPHRGVAHRVAVHPGLARGRPLQRYDLRVRQAATDTEVHAEPLAAH